MKFLPELREFLCEHRTIYTVRGYDMKPAWVAVEGVGVCRRTPLGRIYNREELGPYVGLSGFLSLGDWCDKINEFCYGGKWLYRVEVKDEEDIGRLFSEVKSARIDRLKRDMCDGGEGC